MVIDFHAHCFPDQLAKKAITELEECCYITSIEAVHDGTAGGLKSYMAQCGVDISVVLPVATKPSQVKTINEWAYQSRDSNLLFFGAIHPDDKNYHETIRQLKAEGFRGVKLHPDYQNFFADEKRMIPIYEALRDAGLILALHSGMDIGYPVPVHCTPQMIKNVLGSVKGLCVVAAHMGAHALWRDVEELLTGLPVFFDTSYSYYALGSDGMERMIKRHGAEHVLFGTDSPWTKADDEIKKITALHLPQADIDKILYSNASSLLG